MDPPDEGVESVLSHLERVTGEAAEAVTEASSDAIRLRRALDTLPQGVIVCDENGDMLQQRPGRRPHGHRHGDALAAQAVTELLENAWATLGRADPRSLRAAAAHARPSAPGSSTTAGGPSG